MSKITVKTHQNPAIGEAVFAVAEIDAGERVIQSQAEAVISERNKYSLEINGQHVLISKPGVLVNHSCDPNCVIQANPHGAFDFIAQRPIEAGEEITFDYLSNETEIMGFQSCECGAHNCRQNLAGN